MPQQARDERQRALEEERGATRERGRTMVGPTASGSGAMSRVEGASGGPRGPADAALSTVIDAMSIEHGYGQFGAADGAEIRCFNCHRTFPASGVTADVVTRLEGASDPADMMIVMPVACPSCGTAGTLVLTYGAAAASEDSDVLFAVQRTPGEGAL